MPNVNNVHNTRHSNNITDYFKDWLLKYQRNKFDLNIKNSVNLNIAIKNLLNFILPSVNSIFDFHNVYGIKLLKRLRLDFSQPYVNKCRHCFQDTLNQLCDCDNTETKMHFLLHFSHFFQTLLTNIRNISKLELKIKFS